ncbi:hypothetical protein WJX73_007607 [Symbiochloris irregularis]|uniref:Uncharacterized protein n=1 Tax=Symbiochloris irregularis TaxID=706552 RepID=A0AAW1PNY6_9CHLO
MASSSCLPKGLALGASLELAGEGSWSGLQYALGLNEQNAIVPGAQLSSSALLHSCWRRRLLPARAAFIDMTDVRKTGAKEGMDSADQARDDNEDARKRFAFQKDVKSYLDKKQFPRVSNELSLQIGNLRYDLRQIASAGDKAARKAAEKESKQALKALETLDQYARQNKANEANQAYADALQKLGNLVKAYG